MSRKKLNKQNILDFKSTSLSILRAEIFTNYTPSRLNTIEELDLTRNQIVEIDPAAFRPLVNLRVLNLSKNGLEHVTARIYDSFEWLSNLKELSLMGNRIWRIDKKAFVKLAGLRVLSLGSNELSEIDEQIHASFESLTGLEMLDLGGNKLQKIDQQVFECLVNLKALILMNNELKQLPTEIFKSLPGLEILDLSENKLWKLEKSTFMSLRSLKMLSLCRNEFVRIEKEVFDPLESLELLDLSGNSIRVIDRKAFRSLRRLRKLVLNSNGLSELEEYVFRAFDYLGHLQELELNGNRLKKIDPRAFEKLTGLRELSLCENMIGEITWPIYKSFGCLSTLQGLNLRSNRIERIHPKAFEKLRGLRKLIIDHNRLTTLDPDVFEPLSSSIGLIDLRKNHFSSKIVSYLNETILGVATTTTTIMFNVGQVVSLNDYKQLMIKNGGFLSVFDEFLSQANKVSTPCATDNLYVGKTLNTYLIERQLASGAFGKSFAVLNLSQKNDKMSALKVLNPDDVVQGELLDLLIRINHENIVKYYEYFQATLQGSNSPILCIIGDFYQRNLIQEIEKRIESGTSFPVGTVLKWTLEAAYGLEYLHSQNLIHRDIKPANLLMTNDSVLKIADMSVCKINENTVRVYSSAGTREYMSPEMLRSRDEGNKKYPYKTDIWSLGCVLFELLTLTKAFPFGIGDRLVIPDDFNGRDIFFPLLEKMLKVIVAERLDSKRLFIKLMDLHMSLFM